MEKTKYELRADALKRLVKQLNGPNGRGGIAKVARIADFPESLIGRMLYPPGKPNGKKIGEDSVDKLSAKFPNWLDAPQTTTTVLNAKEPVATFNVERVAYMKPPQDKITDEIIGIINALDSVGRAMALAAIKVALHDYKPAAHQTPEYLSSKIPDRKGSH
jgi:hypothetical protein